MSLGLDFAAEPLTGVTPEGFQVHVVLVEPSARVQYDEPTEAGLSRPQQLRLQPFSPFTIQKSVVLSRNSRVLTCLRQPHGLVPEHPEQALPHIGHVLRDRRGDPGPLSGHLQAPKPSSRL